MRRRKLDDRSPLRTTGGGEGQDVRHRDASSADYDGFTASRRCRHRPGRELPWNGIAHVSKPAADARAEAPESPAAGCPSSRREREARRSIPARRDAQERRKPRATRVRRHGQAHGLIRHTGRNPRIAPAGRRGADAPRHSWSCCSQRGSRPSQGRRCRRLTQHPPPPSARRRAEPATSRILGARTAKPTSM